MLFSEINYLVTTSNRSSNKKRGSIGSKEIAGENFVRHIADLARKAVGEDYIGICLESGEIVDHAGFEELVLGEDGFIDDDLDSLGLYPLHDPLDRGLAVVVRPSLHHKAIDSNDFGLSRDDPVGKEILAGAVRIDNSADQVLRHFGVIREELLGVLGKAVTAVAEGGIVVMRADPRIEAHPVDDLARIHPARHGIAVELVEICDAHGEIGVGEKLDRLGFIGASKEHGHVLFDRPFEEEFGEPAGVSTLIAHDDAAWVQVVIKRAPLAKELGREHHAVGIEPLADTANKSDWDGGFDDDGRARIKLQHKADHALDARSIKVIRLGVIVRWRRHNDEIRIGIGFFLVGRG